MTKKVNTKSKSKAKTSNKEYPIVDIPVEEVFKTVDVINAYNLALCNITMDFIEISTGRKIKFDLNEALNNYKKFKSKKKK